MPGCCGYVMTIEMKEIEVAIVIMAGVHEDSPFGVDGWSVVLGKPILQSHLFTLSCSFAFFRVLTNDWTVVFCNKYTI